MVDGQRKFCRKVEIVGTKESDSTRTVYDYKPLWLARWMNGRKQQADNDQSMYSTWAEEILPSR